MPHFQTVILAASLVFACVSSSRADLVVNMSPATFLDGLAQGNPVKSYRSREFGTHNLSDSGPFGSFFVTVVDNFSSATDAAQIDIRWDAAISGPGRESVVIVRQEFNFEVLEDVYLSLPINDAEPLLSVVRNRDFDGTARLAQGDSLTLRAGDSVSASLFHGEFVGRRQRSQTANFRISFTAVPEPASALPVLLALSIVARRDRIAHRSRRF